MTIADQPTDTAQDVDSLPHGWAVLGAAAALTQPSPSPNGWAACAHVLGCDDCLRRLAQIVPWDDGLACMILDAYISPLARSPDDLGSVLRDRLEDHASSCPRCEPLLADARQHHVLADLEPRLRAAAELARRLVDAAMLGNGEARRLLAGWLGSGDRPLPLAEVAKTAAGSARPALAEAAEPVVAYLAGISDSEAARAAIDVLLPYAASIEAGLGLRLDPISEPAAAIDASLDHAPGGQIVLLIRPAGDVVAPEGTEFVVEIQPVPPDRLNDFAPVAWLREGSIRVAFDPLAIRARIPLTGPQPARVPAAWAPLRRAFQTMRFRWVQPLPQPRTLFAGGGSLRSAMTATSPVPLTGDYDIGPDLDGPAASMSDPDES